MNETAKVKLPVHLGMPGEFGTYNADILNDADGVPVARLAGLPLHTTLEETRKLAKERRWAPALQRADHLISILNSHTALIEAARAADRLIGALQNDPLNTSTDRDPSSSDPTASKRNCRMPEGGYDASL